MDARLTLDELVVLVRETIGTRGSVHAIDSGNGELFFTMYDAFGFKCGLDPRYGSFGLVLPVGAGMAISTFLGRRVSMNPDAQSIRESLELVNEYCRLRLPDKYLQQYDRTHSTSAQQHHADGRS